MIHVTCEEQWTQNDLVLMEQAASGTQISMIIDRYSPHHHPHLQT